jgi:hypothetical protein
MVPYTSGGFCERWHHWCRGAIYNSGGPIYNSGGNTTVQSSVSKQPSFELASTVVLPPLFINPRGLMMEEAHPTERHHHAILITGFDYIPIAQRAARLHNVGDTVTGSAIDIIAEGNETVRPQRHAL